MITLRHICDQLKLDPREARVKVRAAAKKGVIARVKPWQWPEEKVGDIKALLSAKEPSKEMKPAKKHAATKKPAKKK